MRRPRLRGLTGCRVRCEPCYCAAAFFATAAGLVPSSAAAFGTVNTIGFGQHAEHERITRLALGCRAGEPPDDGSCFEPASLANVAGSSTSLRPPKSGSFGAVGAADDQPLRLGWGGPYYWHCDDADFLHVPYGYPQTRAHATQKPQACRSWARAMLLTVGQAASRNSRPASS